MRDFNFLAVLQKKFFEERPRLLFFQYIRQKKFSKLSDNGKCSGKVWHQLLKNANRRRIQLCLPQTCLPKSRSVENFMFFKIPANSGDSWIQALPIGLKTQAISVLDYLLISSLFFRNWICIVRNCGLQKFNQVRKTGYWRRNRQE